VREVCVQYGTCIWRGSPQQEETREMTEEGYFFSFLFPQPNKLNHNKDTASLAGYGRVLV